MDEIDEVWQWDSPNEAVPPSALWLSAPQRLWSLTRLCCRPHARAQDGRTALHVATAMEQLECMTLLLEANADVDAEDIVRIQPSSSPVASLCRPCLEKRLHCHVLPPSAPALSLLLLDMPLKRTCNACYEDSRSQLRARDRPCLSVRVCARTCGCLWISQSSPGVILPLPPSSSLSVRVTSICPPCRRLTHTAIIRGVWNLATFLGAYKASIAHVMTLLSLLALLCSSQTGAEVPPNTRVHPSVRVLAHARAVDRLTSLHTSEVTAAVSRMSDALNERLEPRALPEGDAERSHARLGVLLDTAGERAVRRRALEQQSAAAGIKGRPPSAVTTLAGAVLLRHCAEEAERDAARRCVALLEELFSLSRSGGGESSGSTGPEAKAEPQQPIAGAACEAGCAAAIAAAATASVKAVTVGCSPGETSVSAAEEQDGQGSNESRLRSRRARLDLFASAVCVGKWGRAIQAREASAAAERAARLALDSTRALAELFAERLATAGELKRLSRRAQGMGPELWVVGDGAGDDDGTSSENGGYPM